MILRNLERLPVRAAMTVAGIAGSVAILISGTFWSDAVDHFIEIQFHVAQPADVYLGFTEPVAESVRFDLMRLPGVQQVETSRAIGAAARGASLLPRRRDRPRGGRATAADHRRR